MTWYRTPYRGKTFSPAQRWIDGGPPFAFEKLAEVRSYLLDLCEEEEARGDKRHWWQRRQVRWQRVYDLQDAATTVSDAIHYIDPDGSLQADPPPIFAALSEEELAELPEIIKEEDQ